MKLCSSIIVISLLSGSIYAKPLNTGLQDDTLFIIEAESVPVIDGNADDACWQNTGWQTIDMVWIPWNGSVTSEDFTGKYKVAWSSETNLLYFIAQTTDDVIVDDYEYGVTADNYNFDILEVFIDEDYSRGRHVFDDPPENAENAFAYHMWVEYPDEGKISSNFRVEDLAGTGWDNAIHMLYNDHFDSFIVKEQDGIFTWEFSIKVYNDSYDHDTPEASRVKLTDGKIIGLSLAYCDNDDLEEQPRERDNFYGSVYVPEEANNGHWEDAEYFGTAMLVSSDVTTNLVNKNKWAENLEIVPNPTDSGFKLTFNNKYLGDINVSVINSAGHEVLNQQYIKNDFAFNQSFSYILEQGYYLISLQVEEKVKAVKSFIVN